MMGYTAPSKKAIKDAIKVWKETGGLWTEPVIVFSQNIQETSMFGRESKVPGENTVVGPDAYRNRKWYATLTVNADGIVTAIR